MPAQVDVKIFKGSTTFVPKANVRRIEVVSEVDFINRISSFGISTFMVNQFDGKLYSWGVNGNGQLGQNAVTPVSSPVAVVGANTWNYVQQLYATANGVNNTTLGIDSTGALYTWGWNGANAGNAVLGQGNTTTTFAVSSPVQIAATRRFMRADWISTGTLNNGGIALDTDGFIWGWGQEITTGRFGNGQSGISPSVPIQVAGSTRFVSYTWEGGFSCFYGIDTVGNVWAWGSNSAGMAGQNVSPGVVAGYSSPVQVALPNGVVASRIIQGGSESVFVLDTIGRLWAWGHNQFGQLGLGLNPGTTVSVSSPTQVATPGTGKYWVDVWAINGGFGTAAAVCALDSAGGIWTWGSNGGFSTAAGFLGQNQAAQAFAVSSPVQITPAGVTMASLVKTTANNFAYGNPIWQGTSAFQTSCFGAIDTNGNLWMWGPNATSGQCGTGQGTLHVSSPTQTVGTIKWASVFNTANGNITGATYGISVQGNLYSWGSNVAQALGQGSAATGFAVSSPVQVVMPNGAPAITQLFIGNSSTLFAADTDGNLYAFGVNTSGAGGGNVAPNVNGVFSSPIQVVGSKSLNLQMPQTFTEFDVVPGQSYAVQMQGVFHQFGTPGNLRQVGALNNKISIVYNT